MTHHIFEYDDLPEKWQETAKRDGIRSINRNANETPATQADIIRLEREHERLNGDTRRHARELDLDPSLWHGGRPRLDRIDQIIEDTRAKQEASANNPSPAVPLSAIALVLSIAAFIIAIVS